MTNGNFAFDSTPAEIDIGGQEYDCSYLPDRRACMHYRLAIRLTEARYEQLLERGWRRFGRTVFRPVCSACSECRSIRVNLSEFRPSKSQRRCRNRNSDIQVSIHRPTVTTEHLDLYNDYHRDMHQRRQWPYREITQSEYVQSFLEGQFSFSREFQYRLDRRLVAVGLVDITRTAMSSIYFVHSADLRSRGLGTYSLLHEIGEGRRSRRRWLYLGYYIQDCPSMNYKNRFHPCEILDSYVSDDEPATWLPVGRTS